MVSISTSPCTVVGVVITVVIISTSIPPVAGGGGGRGVRRARNEISQDFSVLRG